MMHGRTSSMPFMTKTQRSCLKRRQHLHLPASHTAAALCPRAAQAARSILVIPMCRPSSRDAKVEDQALSAQLIPPLFSLLLSLPLSSRSPPPAPRGLLAVFRCRCRSCPSRSTKVPQGAEWAHALLLRRASAMSLRCACRSRIKLLVVAACLLSQREHAWQLEARPPQPAPQAQGSRGLQSCVTPHSVSPRALLSSRSPGLLLLPPLAATPPFAAPVPGHRAAPRRGAAATAPRGPSSRA
jgi:hypothetical protein